jgi:phosphatidylserine/phosphatidylglycerophosphate/cardiolipin synthase-like enzyme
MWNDDIFGLVLKASEIKLYFNGDHTWAMKLSQLSKQDGTVRIITYSLPDIEYVIDQIGKRPHNIFIICHSKFIENAKKIKGIFHDIRIAVNDSVHSKVCLIEPDTIYIGSANFGHSGWHESIVGIRSKEAHNAYVEESFDKLWELSNEIEGINIASIHNSVLAEIKNISIPGEALLKNASVTLGGDGDIVCLTWPSEKTEKRFEGSNYHMLCEGLYSYHLHKKVRVLNLCQIMT